MYTHIHIHIHIHKHIFSSSVHEKDQGTDTLAAISIQSA